MNSGQKTAVSMLITVVLFAAFLFTAYSPLFSKIETKFYQPERIEQERARVKESSDYCNTYIQNFLKTTEEYAKADCIQSYFSQTPSESDVQARVQITGELFTNVSGLDGLRLVDKNGRNLHFSTYSEDIAKQNGTARVYKNYADIQAVPGESSFELISIPDSDGPKTPKITFNEEKGLINISHPIEDKYGVYRGTFVFYCKTGNIEKGLIKENLISVTDSLTLFTDQNGKKGGFVIGLPKVGRELFQTPVKDSWKEKSAGPDRVLESEDNKYWVSLSDYSSDIFSISEIYTNDYFELPGTTRILICICVFITVFLIVFLIFSFKTDDMVVIRSRIKKIQFAFVSEYLENKESVDWELVSNQIEGRKADLFRDVKQSLGRKGRKHEKQVDLLLNKSWDEILSAIGTKKEYVKSVSMNDAATSAELKRMLEEVLSTTKIKLEDTRTSVASAGPVVTAQSSSEVEDIEDIEDADIVEDADVIEEADTVEEISEEIETVEDADAVEEVESVEEVDAV
ncbi:MAG: hypothetical protein HUK25_10055, partial [Treponema sp.]|nr:hypothetical protein [Treponema sp.]